MSDEFYEAEIMDNNDQNNGGDFDDVFELTKYSASDVSTESDSFIVAEYDNIEVNAVTINQTKIAKKFVQEVRKLVKSHSTNDLPAEFDTYLKSVADLQLSQLADLLTMFTMNREMLGNMVKRINATQADDYALIQGYTQLVQQQLKLHKELQTTYSNIPAIMKKMVIDIDDNVIDKNAVVNPVISESYGSNQFNNSKEMLNNLRKKQAEKKAKLAEGK